MALAARYGLAGVLIVCFSVGGGCAANKTGSQWSLASINPFKKAQTAEPYPQKPSAFATPSAVPGDKQGASLASASTQGGPLYPSTTPRVYSSPTSSQNALNSSSLQQASGQLSSNPGQSSSPYSPVNRYDPNAFTRNQNQTVQAQPVGAAVASDTSTVDLGGTAGGYPTSQNTAGMPTRSPVGLATPASSSPVSGYSGGLPVSYDTASSPALPTGSNTGLMSQQPTSATKTTSQGLSSGSSSALPGNALAPQNDWSELVGDRYAQMYRQAPQTANADANLSAGGGNSPLGATGYVPGDTGYVPGQTPNPPGNISYQPGQTGYQPPGIPPYTPPYAVQNNGVPGAPAGTGASVPAPSNSGEYRPGSTKIYIPRSTSLPQGSSTSSGFETTSPRSAGVVTTVPTSSPSTEGESFRL